MSNLRQIKLPEGFDNQIFLSVALELAANG